MLLRATIALLFAVLVCYKQVNCMCSFPCNWQKRTFYNEAAGLNLFVPNAYQLNVAPDTVIDCLIREGPFIVGRRPGNVYRCIKINDVCEDSFVVIQTPLIKLEYPPNLCDICTPGNLTSKPQVWVENRHSYFICCFSKREHLSRMRCTKELSCTTSNRYSM
ncbi:uncharacterized protein [Mytilus edulis]|uniref:uncharacterized protein isoform X2 n=1 Tax=Mytilus edulis TaxID=6550 RepID=UPI0039F0E627